MSPDSHKNPIAIVFSCDNNYVPHLGALLVSIISNTQERNIEFIVLDGGIKDDEKEKLQSILSKFGLKLPLTFISMNDRFKGFFVHRYLTEAMYYRLALPEILPNHKKVLYLDTDLIMLDDVKTIFNHNMNGKAVGACTGTLKNVKSFIPNSNKAIFLWDYFKEVVGIQGNLEHYFNSGVLLFDLEKMRELNISSKMISEVQNNNYLFPDQDILNKYFINDYSIIETKWNFYPKLCEEEFRHLAPKKPSIIHFVGFEKPWNTNTVFGSEYYYQYLRSTPWYEKVLLNLIEKKLSKPKLRLRMYHFILKIWAKVPRKIRLYVKPISEQIGLRFLR